MSGGGMGRLAGALNLHRVVHKARWRVSRSGPQHTVRRTGRHRRSRGLRRRHLSLATQCEHCYRENQARSVARARTNGVLRAVTEPDQIVAAAFRKNRFFPILQEPKRALVTVRCITPASMSMEKCRTSDLRATSQSATERAAPFQAEPGPRCCRRSERRSSAQRHSS
jgi:hypothetical protein